MKSVLLRPKFPTEEGQVDLLHSEESGGIMWEPWLWVFWNVGTV